MDELTLLTEAQRIKKIKQAADNVKAKRAERLLSRKRELEFKRDLERLENGE